MSTAIIKRIEQTVTHIEDLWRFHTTDFCDQSIVRFTQEVEEIASVTPIITTPIDDWTRLKVLAYVEQKTIEERRRLKEIEEKRLHSSLSSDDVKETIKATTNAEYYHLIFKTLNHDRKFHYHV